MLSIDINLDKIAKQIKDVKGIDDKLREVAKKTTNKLASRLHARVVRNTPVGHYEVKTYPDGRVYNRAKKGGELRQAWTVGGLQKTNNSYRRKVYNPLHYAEYVENGHKQQVGRFVPQIGKKLVKPYVEGQFMLRKAHSKTSIEANKIVEELLKGV